MYACNVLTIWGGRWNIAQYNSQNPQPSHFTQVVWKATKQLGCAVQTCAGIFPPQYGVSLSVFANTDGERAGWVAECASSLQNAKYYACEYFPAGNVIGQFPYVALISPLVVGSVLTCSGFAEQAERTVSAGLCGEGLVPPKRRRG